MYTIGTFSDTNEQKAPGVYTRMSINPGNRNSSATYGGLALPWVSYTYQAEPNPIPLASSTISMASSNYVLANPSTFRTVGASILTTTTPIYLCPFNVNLQPDISAPPKPDYPEGTSTDGKCNVWVADYGDEQEEMAAYQPLKVTISPTEGGCSAVVSYPFPGVTHTDEFPIDMTDAVDGKKFTKHIEYDEKGDTEVLWTVYGGSLALAFIIKEVPTQPVEVMVGGGCILHRDHAKKTIEDAIEKGHDGKRLDGLRPGSLIAFPYISETFEDPETDNFMYIKDSVVPAGTDCFAVVEMGNGKVTLTSYTCDTITLETVARVVEEKHYLIKNGMSENSIRSTIQTLVAIDGFAPTVGLGGSNAWEAQLPEDQTVRIGFMSAHLGTARPTRHDPVTFMPTIGKTQATVAFYVPYESDFGEGRDAARRVYQYIQKQYVENAKFFCPSAQLVMDETCLDGCDEWDENTQSLTISSPVCVSLAGDSRGGVNSLRNSAYMAGILARCGITRSATAYPYPGGRDLQLYGQKVIEHMLTEGVMTWHSHAGDLMVYIDASSYREGQLSIDGAKYPKAFERNLPVRAVNMFRYMASENFIAHYFEQNRYGSAVETIIIADLMRILDTLAYYDVIQEPEAGDITVSRVSARTYSAEVKLNMINPVEVLLITLEV